MPGDQPPVPAGQPAFAGPIALKSRIQMNFSSSFPKTLAKLFPKAI
jgi:hypothetical protein